jgi:NADH dehydrogenase
MSQLVTIFGGSGFIGRYIARRMAKQGWRVRVASRRPNEAMFVRTYGAVGQVEPVLCNIRDDASVRSALQGADAVVNCVGILTEDGRNSFDAVQAEGAGRVARQAADEGISNFVQLSAIGVDEDADSHYASSKALGEAAVLDALPGAVILRPSVVFGPEDGFFNRFAAMSKFGPVLSIVGGDTMFQPVYVDDVAKAAEKALNGQAVSGVYELGGPDQRTLRDLIDEMLAVIHKRRLVINLPFSVGAGLARVFSFVQAVTVGLFHNSILTVDQVKNLKHDNVVSEGAKGFADIGIEPINLSAVIPDYLWRFRPAGQYDDIKASAKNLKV